MDFVCRTEENLCQPALEVYIPDNWLLFRSHNDTFWINIEFVDNKKAEKTVFIIASQPTRLYCGFCHHRAVLCLVSAA